jgi:hypothetical protein
MSALKGTYYLYQMTRSLSKSFIYCKVLMAFMLCIACTTDETKPGWPYITRETKPWTRWWWHGNALTKEGITAEMEEYQRAGLGGLEITPIYGVMGYEDKFINYLSPGWMELFQHTLNEAKRLRLGIDMATGTGWPFGGPWVKREDASRNIQLKIYEIKGGEQLRKKIEFIQQPYLRAVANQVYEVDHRFSADASSAQAIKTPQAKSMQTKLTIEQLVDPIEANNNLQALAIEQIQFEKPLPLVVLMAFNEKGLAIDLTGYVNSTGTLNWTAPEGRWKLYALFEGWHGKLVERAGPGGEGSVIDHFSTEALKHYLQRIDSAISKSDITSLRAFFNDSYEVDDAKGTANWTPQLLDEFKKRRGYDLKEHLPALFGMADEEKNERIRCDYRETISEMLLENFTRPWKTWAQTKLKIVRNQAHGSPSNILDLYATVDIPEIEGVEPLRIKMASSAGNVTGKRLVSSESATWLNEHFESNLSDIKVALDRFMLHGVNHIFYHGTAYSPPGEPWPGWLFYAAVHLNPRNPLWKDFDALNSYVARCQSFLQNSTPNNDVLLYYPIYDRFSTPGKELIEHFDGIGKQFENTAFERSANVMLEKGYGFDYISDWQIRNTHWENKTLITEGKTSYKVLVIPHSKYMPLPTFQKIISLADDGATIIASEGMPDHISGYGSLEENQNTFNDLKVTWQDPNEVGAGIHEIRRGKGRILTGANLDALLTYASVGRESMVDLSIDFIRKKESHNRSLYMIANRKEETWKGWIPLQVISTTAVVYDPMTGNFGKAQIRKNEKGGSEIFIQLNTKQTLFIETYPHDVELSPFNFYSPSQSKINFNGFWKIKFMAGGPTLLPPFKTDSLKSWTLFDNPELKVFSGTASYQFLFKKPEQKASGWLLDLGEVKETAEVILNGKSLGKLIGPVFQIYIDPNDIQDSNILEIRVTNLMANRIADLDKRNVFWKKFYNINFPARKAENRKNGLFDASGWEPRKSGLLGPVTLSELQ